MHNRNAETFIDAALECSVFVAPHAFGLTREELLEAGTRHSLGRGEISDALEVLARGRRFDGHRFLPEFDFTRADFLTEEVPDYRNIDAFQAVLQVLGELERNEGQKTRMARSVLVERAAQEGVHRRDVEAAVSVLILAERLAADKDEIWAPNGARSYAMPKDQQRQRFGKRERPSLGAAFAIVKDIVARREDGRPLAAEPLDAFSERLAPLRYGQFRMWWDQTVAELRRQEPAQSPTAMTVLCAALVEGALTFIVKHARDRQLGVFASNDFSGSANTWKLENLVKSAASGGDSAVLDSSARSRVDELVRARQRIHAGRMLMDFPNGVPDLKPEQAREALATTELTVRRVLIWLEKFPPSEKP
jgi:hypothetical protein